MYQIVNSVSSGLQNRSKADKEVCHEYIEALEACHARGFYKLVGGCNQVKKDLSMCLRKEVSLFTLSSPSSRQRMIECN